RDSERFAHLPRERNEPRLALPTHEPLDHCPAAPAAPARCAVMAVDGSQIEPDFHEVAPCYLINVGHALLRYGRGATGTRLASVPTLFYPERGAVGSKAVSSGQWVVGSEVKDSGPELPTAHYSLPTALAPTDDDV